MFHRIGIHYFGNGGDRPVLVHLDLVVVALHAHFQWIRAHQFGQISAVGGVAVQAGGVLGDDRVFELRFGGIVLDLFVLVAAGADDQRLLFHLLGIIAGVGIVAAGAVLLDRLVRELHLLHLILHVGVTTEAQLASLGDQQLG